MRGQEICIRIVCGIALCLAATWLPAQDSEFPAGLAQGIMAGEVAATSAILQSRLTSTSPYVDPRWEGIPGVDGVGRFEFADNADFRNPSRTGWLHAIPQSDFIIKTKIGGLRPATRYYYRLHYGPDEEDLRTSETATFRTLAGEAGSEPYRIAIVTGMNYSFFHYTGNNGQKKPYEGPDKHLGFPGLESIRKLKPDFFVGTGDNVYYDHPGHRGRAQTLHQMRMKHHEQYSQPRFLNLFREVATYWMKDDHDHRFNDSDRVNPVLIRTSNRTPYYPKTNVHEGESGSGFLPLNELGIAVFREQLPVVDPTDPGALTYRTHRVSRHLQVWFVEGRDYRSPNDMPDGPGKTIWGAEQKAWLKRTLLDSDATFKLLISPTPMVGPDSGGKRDNHVNLNGFRHEGDEFFHWLGANGFTSDNFFIACGDRHWQYHAIHPSGFEEFSCGALVDANSILGTFPGDKNSTDPDAKIRQPYHSPEASGGFLTITVRGEDGDSAGVAEFEFYDEFGKELYRHEKRAAAVVR